MRISSLIADANTMLKVSPRELSCALLKMINSLPEGMQHRQNCLLMPEATNGYRKRSRKSNRPTYKDRHARNSPWPGELVSNQRPNAFAQTCLLAHAFSLQSRGGPYISLLIGF